MPRLEMMLLVLLILPLPYFNAAGEQAVQGDRYLQRGDRAVIATCHPNQPGSPWGRCCRTKMCGSVCCNHAECSCVYHADRGDGCHCE